MSDCPVLEYVEAMVRVMDDFNQKRIGEKVYDSRIQDLKQKIDKAVVSYCVLSKEVTHGMAKG